MSYFVMTNDHDLQRPSNWQCPILIVVMMVGFLGVYMFCVNVEVVLMEAVRIQSNRMGIAKQFMSHTFATPCKFMSSFFCNLFTKLFIFSHYTHFLQWILLTNNLDTHAIDVHQDVLSFDFCRKNHLNNLLTCWVHACFMEHGEIWSQKQLLIY